MFEHMVPQDANHNRYYRNAAIDSNDKAGLRADGAMISRPVPCSTFLLELACASAAQVGPASQHSATAARYDLLRRVGVRDVSISCFVAWLSKLASEGA